MILMSSKYDVLLPSSSSLSFESSDLLLVKSNFLAICFLDGDKLLDLRISFNGNSNVEVEVSFRMVIGDEDADLLINVERVLLLPLVCSVSSRSEFVVAAEQAPSSPSPSHGF